MDKVPDVPPETPRQTTDEDLEEIRRTMTASTSQDEADRKARIEYLRSLTGRKPPKKRSWWKAALKIGLTMIIIAALAGGVFWYFDKQASDNNNSDEAKTAPKATTPVPPQQTASKHYDSTALGLGFNYPADWKVTENNGRLLAMSPAGRFRTASGTVDAQIVFSIQSKQTTLPDFKNGNGLATRISEKVAYARPTPNQRAQTYMTFVGNAGTATGGLDTIYVTGDLGYQKDQAVPQVDIVQGDPLVSIFFAKCNGTACATDPLTAKLTVADSAWADSNPLVKAAKATFLSLTIN